MQSTRELKNLNVDDLMNFASAQRLLRAASRRTGPGRLPELSLSSVCVSQLDVSLSDELYEFSCALSAEPRAHWQQHVETNDEVHLLRDAGTQRLLGFQMWRFGGVRTPEAAIIWGGKLRFASELRRHGLHLMLNLCALTNARERGGHARGTLFHRVALVNMLGFQALRPALCTASTPPLPDYLADVIGPELAPFCCENGFLMDEHTGRVNVGQTLARSPDEFSADWWRRSAVAEFRIAGVGEAGRLSRSEALSRQNDAYRLLVLAVG